VEKYRRKQEREATARLILGIFDGEKFREGIFEFDMRLYSMAGSSQPSSNEPSDIEVLDLGRELTAPFWVYLRFRSEEAVCFLGSGPGRGPNPVEWVRFHTSLRTLTSGPQTP